jgi:uncharacterized protein
MKNTQLSDESVLVKEIEEFAKKCFDGSRGSHDWDHTQRVCRLSAHIGKAEKADLPVLLVAACLHDIGRRYQDKSNGAVCHAEKGAQMAKPLVDKLPLSESQKQNIIHCISSHRFRGNHRPRTPEAKVLFDADKLDAIGAVGIARAYLFAGEVGARLHNPDARAEDTSSYSQDDTGFREFKVKLSKIKDRVMTAEGRRLALERHQFMVDFFERFLEEYEGKR